MIKIEPLLATDYAQMRALLRHQPDDAFSGSECRDSKTAYRGLTFWQHWLPFQAHVGPSVYVAKEDGVILALISIHARGKSKECWQIEDLVVHPHHRGRGIAQELLRYVFALFGGQGVNHFVAELSEANDAALALFAACGFRRATRIIRYQKEFNENRDDDTELQETFRLAVSGDRRALFDLNQDSLPPEIRLILSQNPDDFKVFELPNQKVEKLRNKITGHKAWYWVSEDSERKVLTSAAKVTSHHLEDFHLEFAVHPGWADLAPELVTYALNNLNSLSRKALVTAKAFEFQDKVIESLEKEGFEKVGSYCLLAREHWIRAREPKRQLEGPRVVPALPNPLMDT